MKAAIKPFQSKVVNMVGPDGRIDPNSRTHKKLMKSLQPWQLKITLSYQLPIQMFKSYQSYIAKPFGCRVVAINAIADVEFSGDTYFQ